MPVPDLNIPLGLIDHLNRADITKVVNAAYTHYLPQFMAIAKRCGWGIGGMRLKISRDHTASIRVYTDSDWQEYILDVSFRQLPGCCGVMLAYGMATDTRNNNDAYKATRLGIQMLYTIALYLGYGLMMYTVAPFAEWNDEQEFIYKALRTERFRKGADFVNWGRGDNRILVYTKKTVEI